MVTRLRYVITLAITLLFLASVAAAQGNYGGSMDAREHGYQHGYRDGYKSGYEDGYNNRRLRSDIYGLNDTYDPDRVPRSDRDAEGYPNWSYGDVAFDTGYRDGLGAGQKDLRERKDYRPEKHDSYEDADHGYRKSFGTKDQYKEQYRKGFLRGYQDAFNRRER